MTIISAYTDGGMLKKNSPGNTLGLLGYCYAYRIVRYEELTIGNGKKETILHEHACLVPGYRTNNVAEVMACVEAIKWCWKNKHMDIEICSDSSTALSWIFNPGKKSRDGAEKHDDVMRLLYKVDVLLPDRMKMKGVLHKGHPSIEDLEAGEGRRSRKAPLRPVNIHQDWCDHACNQVKESYLKAIRDSGIPEIDRLIKERFEICREEGSTKNTDSGERTA